MPNFKNYYDLYNTTGDDFNSQGVKCVNDDVWNTYMIADCRKCLRNYNQCKPDCIKDEKITDRIWSTSDLNERFKLTKEAGCNFRVKLSKGPKEKNQYFIIQTLGIRGNPNSIILRRAQLCWLYDNKVPIIIRATQNRVSKVTGMRGNGLVIHHINEDHTDDSIGNAAMVEHHEYKHAVKRTLINAIKLTDESDDLYMGLIKNKLKSAIRLIDSYVEDSSKVWKSIRINEMLINGKITESKCQSMLADINMCEHKKV